MNEHTNKQKGTMRLTREEMDRMNDWILLRLEEQAGINYLYRRKIISSADYGYEKGTERVSVGMTIETDKFTKEELLEAMHFTVASQLAAQITHRLIAFAPKGFEFITIKDDSDYVSGNGQLCVRYQYIPNVLSITVDFILPKED